MDRDSQAVPVVSAHRCHDMAHITVDEALASENALLRVAEPDATILEKIQQRFDLDELHLKDILNAKHPAHFSKIGGAIHLILRFPVKSAGDEDESFELTSVSVLFDERMCALIWPGHRLHRFRDDQLLSDEVEESVCIMIHALVDHLLRRVYALRMNMDEIEDECLDDVEHADMGKLLSMRKELVSMERVALANSVALEKLQGEKPFAGNVRLLDALEHMRRAYALAESKADHALGVMQAVQSLLGQKLNEVMRFLAVVTFILSPMAVITGLFGMNFTHMEVLSNPWGFAMTLWGLASLGVALAVVFRLKRWW